MYRISGRWAWIILAAGLAACGLPRTRYYTMELPHLTRGAGAPIARHITIQRFQANQMLVNDRIVYSENPGEVNYYEYHRWASPPADLVTNHFLHRLKDDGAYAQVSNYREGANSDYILKGQLHRFEEVDKGKEVFASVAVELELFESKTRISVWREEAECTRPLPTRDIAGVVRGLHECLDEAASKLLGSMQERIRKRIQ